MKAGRLIHRIRFLEDESTQSESSGALKSNWVQAVVPGLVLSSVPAEVLTGPGRDYVAANARYQDVAARITLRWFPGFSSSWRVEWDGLLYEIIGHSTDATARVELRLVCKLVVAA